MRKSQAILSSKFLSFKNLFDQPTKNDSKTYDIIRKIATTQSDDYTTGSLIDYLCLKTCYKLTAIDLSKQQKLDVDSKARQQVNFTENIDRGEGAPMFFIIEEVKETVFEFFWRNS